LPLLPKSHSTRCPSTQFRADNFTNKESFGFFLTEDIVRAVASGEPYSTVPYVRPGGEILLRLSGWPKVERVLQAVDAVEVLGIHPADAAPDHWQHVHNRLTAGEEPPVYTRQRHEAWLRRKAIEQ
jgi:hypothetical protein